MPLRLHRLSDAPSPGPDRPLTPDAEDDLSLFRNLYTNLTNLDTALLSTRHALLALYGDRQSLVDFRPSVPATGPLRDLHDGLVEQCRRHIEDLRAHAAELENAIDMIANVLVEWLKEKFESGEEEELEAMLEEWGAGVWLLMG